MHDSVNGARLESINTVNVSIIIQHQIKEERNTSKSHLRIMSLDFLVGSVDKNLPC